MAQPNRIPSRGRTFSYGGSSITPLSAAYVKGEVELEDYRDQSSAWAKRLVVNGAWGVDVEGEIDEITRLMTPALTIGSITGVHLIDYSLKVDVEIGVAAGAMDEWQHKLPTGLDASLTVNKFEATDEYMAFANAAIAMLEGDDSRPSIEAVTAFGTFDVLYESFETADENDVLKEGTELKMAAGSFTKGATYLQAFFTDLAAYATALAAGNAPTALALAIAEGSGLGYLESLEVECPTGKSTWKASCVGTDAFTATP